MATLKQLARQVVFGTYRLLLKRPVEALFHIYWYYHVPKLTFLGVGTIQNPMDMWVKQELIYEVKPDLIIEAGTHRGGSALYYATLLEHVNPNAKVVTIDIESKVTKAREYPIFQKTCECLLGDSTSPEIVAQVRERAAGKKVMVILDRMHRRDHVLKEMELYAPLVSVGSYLFVEDTDVNGHPVMPNYGPGPFEAVQEFMKNHGREFIIDRSHENLGFTLHPSGLLKRVA